ncbi:hypothetical protein Q765_18950 [Flavobacterium rivuli WB 3.3-2 = DSM 21788]|uniref:Transmembrane protein n=1 Tax=Flavobacterium rivuli WB 3.3-2 = DSM 21788 TaxID=1121895 RepID=A0A0A2M9D4_9FLAO|nr:hypothetical protein [Flavobacterium rivuli]KGO84910.1 hypothetical protein Q765_18950 [Flavobacterium rivuli WB 3.3-2 = DSM 21788]
MNTAVFVILYVISDLILALGFFKILTSKYSVPIFIITSVLYLSAVYALAEIFNRLHIYFRHKGYTIETGHASILELEIWFLFQVLSIILIVIALKRKRCMDK